MNGTGSDGCCSIYQGHLFFQKAACGTEETLFGLGRLDGFSGTYEVRTFLGRGQGEDMCHKVACSINRRFNNFAIFGLHNLRSILGPIDAAETSLLLQATRSSFPPWGSQLGCPSQELVPWGQALGTSISVVPSHPVP